MRLFLAVWPPPELVARLRAMPRPATPDVRWTTERHWHVTLRFLGEADADEVTAAVSAASLPPPVAATVGPVTERFGHRVLHVPVAGLDPVAAAVVAVTASIGRPPDDRPFRGHLTLARAVGRSRPDLRPLTGMALAGSWPVDEVTVVASSLGAGGPTYEVVSRRPL